MNQESSRVEWGKQKEILISIFGSVRNQGMIEIGDMRYIEDFFFIWVNFGSNFKNHCVGGNWRSDDVQRAVGPFLVCASGLARFNTLNGCLYTVRYYTHQVIIS